MLNTEKFLTAYRNLDKAKYPSLRNTGSEYAYLCGVLSSMIEAKASEKKVQARLDKLADELIQELSDLSDKVN